MDETIETRLCAGPAAAGNDPAGYRWILSGRVQGVGFRPFVYRLAHDLGVRGYAQNRSGQLVVVGEGPAQVLERFGAALLEQAPPFARPGMVSRSALPVAGWDGFTILPSAAESDADVHLPPDRFCCDDCLAELGDVRNRRYRYPFINCTQCGPRYTLISRLPYDRENTSMARFALCPACRAEYGDPRDRRFHAEPVACPCCGPQLRFHRPGMPVLEGNEPCLDACAGQLRAGGIIAVKGIGGYHLVVDATNVSALARLRERKKRPHKPIAVMFPSDDDGRWLRQTVQLDDAAHAALRSPARPIVLARLQPDAMLPDLISPGLREVGVLLPYSPLHHLLLEAHGKPLVVTSANISGDPVLTDEAEVNHRLAGVVDGALHHDRDILRPADDSVMRVIAGKARPIRCGRGIAPIDMALPLPLREPVLAVGGQMKNTIALGWGSRAIVSPHIGDLDSPRAVSVFEQVIADLQDIYKVKPAAIACDAHPGFAGTRWAVRSGLPVRRVLHHHAHASALAGEHPDIRRWLVFTWDGLGLGDDGTLWGGEGFLGAPGGWRRVSTLRPFRLPGGEQAAREPWRSAAGLCWEAGRLWRMDEVGLAHEAWRRRINCPQTSAAGRLFDAAAALTGLVETSSFEGQGPMWLEAAADGGKGMAIPLPLARNPAGIWQLDWAPLVDMLVDAARSPADRAAAFHASLAHGLLAQARTVRDEHGALPVGLCGGVFQNRLLTEQAVSLLQADGFDVRLTGQLPCNDGGLAFGQLVEAGAIL